MRSAGDDGGAYLEPSQDEVHDLHFDGERGDGSRGWW